MLILKLSRKGILSIDRHTGIFNTYQHLRWKQKTKQLRCRRYNGPLSKVNKAKENLNIPLGYPKIILLRYLMWGSQVHLKEVSNPKKIRKVGLALAIKNNLREQNSLFYTTKSTWFYQQIRTSNWVPKTKKNLSSSPRKSTMRLCQMFGTARVIMEQPSSIIVRYWQGRLPKNLEIKTPGNSSSIF